MLADTGFFPLVQGRRHRLAGSVGSDLVADEGAEKGGFTTAPLGGGPLTAKIGSDFRVDRMMRDIQFSAPPEVASAVLADLERLPVMSTISRLQIRTADGKDKETRQVRVTMTVETWLQARKGKK